MPGASSIRREGVLYIYIYFFSLSHSNYHYFSAAGRATGWAGIHKEKTAFLVRALRLSHPNTSLPRARTESERAHERRIYPPARRALSPSSSHKSAPFPRWPFLSGSWCAPDAARSLSRSASKLPPAGAKWLHLLPLLQAHWAPATPKI